MVDIAIYDVHKRYIFMWKSHNNNSLPFRAIRFPYAGMKILASRSVTAEPSYRGRRGSMHYGLWLMPCVLQA